MNETFKPFQQVLVRYDSEDKWHCDLFSFASRGDICGDYYVCAGGSYAQCIPYEGNEHLLGTTDGPKPKRWRANRGDKYWYVAVNGTAMEMCDFYEEWDNKCYESCNYFRTLEEAEKLAEKFKQLLLWNQKN